MQQALFACACAALTVAGIAFAANHQPSAPVARTPTVMTQVTHARPRVDLVFVLDTTGSMDGLLQAAKEKIWSIASTMAQAQPAPEIRIGLVGFRDRGDEYVTRVFDLTSDLDSMYAHLMDFRAGGGGDGPESVNAALADAVERMDWSSAPGAYKAMFLVGDAPPHMDYQDDTPYTATVAAARERGIVVNTIRCGNDAAVLAPWQQIASLGQGKYLEVDTNGSAVAMTSPYDRRLAELGAALDDTRLHYGSAQAKAAGRAKDEATSRLEREASLAARARRATFNAYAVGSLNALGEQDLLRDLDSGKVQLEALAPAELPAAIAALPAPARAAALRDKAAERRRIERELRELAASRADYLAREVRKAGGAAKSLDAQLFGTLREQAAREGGMTLDAKGPAY